MTHDCTSEWPGIRSPVILVDATPLQSEHRMRGVGTYTRHLLHELEQLRPGGFCYSAARDARHLLPPELVEATVVGFRPHRPGQVYWLYNEWFMRRMLCRARPALFHATDFNGLLRVRDVPTVTTLYDLTPFKDGFHQHGLSARLSDLRWWIYYYRKLPRADHIIAISESARRDAIDLLGLPGEQVSAIPLGVDQVRFRPLSGMGRYASEPTYALFIGGRAANKNLDRVIDAFAQVAGDIPDLHLYLAGTWRDGDDRWLLTRCPDAGIRRRIRVLGFVPEDDLASLYTHAQVFLFPSLEEGFGLPVLEAMACGTPVITSNTGALLEVGADAALLVDPQSTTDLAYAMYRLSVDASLRLDLRRQGLLHVQRYSWNDMARRTLEVYDTVLQRTPAGRRAT